jgi:hypothetical protein
MFQDDASYYRQRAVTHRAMLLAAERQNVREIHEEFARQYEALTKSAQLRSMFMVAAPGTDRADTAGSVLRKTRRSSKAM